MPAPTLQQILSITEQVLEKAVSVAVEIFGPIVAALEKSLTGLLIHEHQKLDISGGCGKMRLDAETRGEKLRIRIVLTPEARAGGCEPDAIRWAERTYQEAAALGPIARDMVQTLVVEDNGNGSPPELIKKFPPT